MVAAGLPEPTFEPNGFFRAIFRRCPEFAMKGGSEKTREKILGLIRKDPKITMAELAQAVDLTVKGVEWNIRQLKRQGRLRRVGPAKGGRWESID